MFKMINKNIKSNIIWVSRFGQQETKLYAIQIHIVHPIIKKCLTLQKGVIFPIQKSL